MKPQAINLPSGFEQLVRDHLGRIRRIARRYAADDALDDLVQEILTRLWRSFAGFRGEAKVETWIYRVALNAAMTHLAKAVKARDLQEDLVNKLAASEGVQGMRAQKTFCTTF